MFKGKKRMRENVTDITDITDVVREHVHVHVHDEKKAKICKYSPKINQDVFNKLCTIDRNPFSKGSMVVVKTGSYRGCLVSISNLYASVKFDSSPNKCKKHFKLREIEFRTPPMDGVFQINSNTNGGKYRDKFCYFCNFVYSVKLVAVFIDGEFKTSESLKGERFKILKGSELFNYKKNCDYELALSKHGSSLTTMIRKIDKSSWTSWIANAQPKVENKISTPDETVSVLPAVKTICPAIVPPVPLRSVPDLGTMDSDSVKQIQWSQPPLPPQPPPTPSIKIETSVASTLIVSTPPTAVTVAQVVPAPTTIVIPQIPILQYYGAEILSIYSKQKMPFLFSIPSDSDVYNVIRSTFMRTINKPTDGIAKRVDIKDISAFINIPLWKKYESYLEMANFKESMRKDAKVYYDQNEKKLKHQLNSQVLFHGTSKRGAQGILYNGFMTQMSGRELWGSGIYFSKTSEYSIDFSKNNDNVYTMIIALVTVGRIGQGSQSLKIGNLPDQSYFENDRPETLVNSLSDPTIYCCTDNGQAYPCYKIEFTINGNW